MPHPYSSCAAASLLVALSLPAQLVGTYTVNPTWPASGTNFVSLAAVHAALTTQGVGGPVTVALYDDAGPFTEANPFVAGAGTFSPETAVLVLGSYPGASASRRITFRPAAGERVVFDAAGRSMGVFWGGADYVTLQGIEIRHAIHDAISLYADGVHGIAQDPIIDGCRLHDCGGTGVTIYGNTPQPANTVVQNCVLWRLQLTNAGGFPTTGRFAYVTTRRTNGTRLLHNTFLADSGTGSSFAVIGAFPSGASEAPYAEISNNVVLKTAGAGKPILRFQSPNGSTALVPPVGESNLFFDLTASPFALYGPNAATTAATLADWQLATGKDLASLWTDPLLRDAAAHDAHLTAGSPARGASSVASPVGMDADRQPRTAPGDVGADHYGSGDVTAVGSGCAGAGGQHPTLASSWPWLGDPEYSVHLASAPPQALGVLFGSLGTSTAPLPLGGGGAAWLDLATLTALQPALTSQVGTASFLFVVPANPAFLGFRLGYQAIVLDATAPLGLVVSGALDITFGS
jgi:hypothetical protein